MRRLFPAVRAMLLAIVLILSLSRAASPLPVRAEPLPEETRKLLEKSLSVVEIDREIERIASLRLDTQAQITESERRLVSQEAAITVQREKAGRVLRAYYMGQRDFVLAALLNAKSLDDLLTTWEAMDIVITADNDTLNRYTRQYAELRDGYAALQRDRDELAEVERSLQEQRARLLALQEEVDRALAASGDEQHLRQLMAELESYWRNVGLFEVRRRFRALAEAMQDLPDWIKQHPEALERKGLKAKLTITDAQLNEFLRSRGDGFAGFAITFEPGSMTVAGDNGDMQVAIRGHYTIQDEPENAIIFHVDGLTFNGLALPDTTRADLEREFDLGFYPEKLIQFVKADEVRLEEGQLVVQLKIG